MAIPQRTGVAAARVDGNLARAASRNLASGDRIREFTVGSEVVTRTWLDYVQGLTQATARFTLK